MNIFPEVSPQRYPPPPPLAFASLFWIRGYNMYPDFARKKSLRYTIFYSKTKLESSYRYDNTHAVEKKVVGVGGLR